MGRLVFIFTFIILSYSTAFSQSLLDQQIELFEVEKESLKTALLKSAEMAGVSISFNGNLFSDNATVNLSLKNKSLRQILDVLLRNHLITYKENEQGIILLPRSPNRRTISGYVEDVRSGEKLIGAYVVDYKNGKGTFTNKYGFFNLTLSEGVNKIQISYVGYQDMVKEVYLKGNLRTNFKLQPSNSLSEVLVTATKLDTIKSTSIYGNTDDVPTRKRVLKSEDLGAASTLGGESDIFQQAYLNSGVQSGVGGVGGIHVRGGHEDQNLVLMDGVTVYNHSHALGSISIFNSSAINKATLIKGGIPAQYGGRLSSVLDVRTKEGNLKNYEGDVFIGTFATRLSLQGPIVKDKAGFFVTVRRTHLEPFLGAISKIIRNEKNDEEKLIYRFYDVNAKLHWEISRWDKVFYSFYHGGDRYINERSDSDSIFTNVNGIIDVLVNRSDIQNQRLKWGNNIQSIRWNHQFGSKLFMNTTGVFSRYNYTNFQISEAIISDIQTDTIIGFNNSLVNLVNDITEVGLRTDFDYAINSHHYMKFGASFNFKKYAPGFAAAEDADLPTDSLLNLVLDSTYIEPLVSREISTYIQHKISEGNLTLDMGVYASLFANDGKAYYSVEPRLIANMRVLRGFNMNFTATRMTQNIHLLSNESINLPNDLWVPATRKARPQSAWQTSLGFNWNINKQLSYSAEGYYKKMKNLLAYRTRIENPQIGTIVAKEWEDEVVQGNGESYGIETMLIKKGEKTNGQISYTYSKTNRQYESLNDGETFPYSYDRRHLIQIMLQQKLADHISLSANWTYGTGRPITLISTDIISFFQDNSAEIISDINGHRLPDFHQLNIGLDFHFKKKWGGHKLSLGLYNAYNNENAFFQYKDRYSTDDELTTIPYLPILPSFSYSFYIR